jgi:photosystem II stability/assembly factor-like uncharacterized protein
MKAIKEQFKVLDPVSLARIDVMANHPIFEELALKIVTGDADGVSDGIAEDWAEDLEPGPDPFLPQLGAGPAQRRRRALVSAGLALVLLAIALAVVAGTRGQTAGLTTTPWRAARSLPSGTHVSVPHGHAGSWELVGDIVRSGWQLNTSGPAPGDLTCPTTTACYVTGNTATKDTGPPVFDSLYFSGDSGHTWSVLALPNGFAFTAPVSCSGPGTCLAAGVVGGRAVLIETSDGGHEWAVSPLSIPGRIVSLQCASSSSCNGITVPDALVPTIEDTALVLPTNIDEHFVHSTDGGHSWSSSALPPVDRVTSMVCPGATECTAVGYVPSAPETAGDYSGFVLYTNDGGSEWENGVLPGSFGFTYLSTLSCTDATHCMALGVVTAPNPYQCGVSPEKLGTRGWSCTSGATARVTGIVTTDDGGGHWQLRPLPSDVPLPSMYSVSCADATTCWVSGSEAVPQGNNGGSAVLLGTTDDGVTWSKVTFVVPQGAPNDVGSDAYMSVGQISCPNSGGCIALGVVDQGSSSTPVYSDIGNGGP